MTSDLLDLKGDYPNKKHFSNLSLNSNFSPLYFFENPAITDLSFQLKGALKLSSSGAK